MQEVDAAGPVAKDDEKERSGSAGSVDGCKRCHRRMSCHGASNKVVSD